MLKFLKSLFGKPKRPNKAATVKPIILGVDLADGPDKTVIYSQPARRQGKTAQQAFRERGVSAMAAARRGEEPARRVSFPAAHGASYPARSSVSNTTVVDGSSFSTNLLWIDNSSSDSSNCDSGSSDSSSCDSGSSSCD